MKNRLPKQIKLIPISEAARVLGVSIDTVRRWDKSGVLHSERPDGKNRYFSQVELEKHKSSQPLSISEAAKELGISAITLRRFEARNLIKPIRNSAGERAYTKDSLNEFLDSNYLQTQKKVQEKESEPQPPEKLERPNLKPRSILPHFIAITVTLFLLLETIAVGNIKLSEAKSSQPLQPPVPAAVLPETTKAEKTVETNEAGIPSTDIVEPKVILIVKINDGADMVNIRQKPTTDSEIVGKAQDGEAFEFISLDSGWYGVKLDSGSTGFISARYIDAEGSNK